MTTVAADHLGHGIVVFRKALSVDSLLVDSYMHYLQEQDAAEKYLKSGDTAVNSGGYEFSDDSIGHAPLRYSDTLPHGLPIEYRKFVEKLENTNYKCLVEYCKIFPTAVEAVTWKKIGHFAVYTQGQGIGCHSDSAVPLVDGKPVYGQSPLYNTLTCGVSLTSDYTGGELYFKMWDISVTLNAGDVAIYPSTFIGAHEVLPVKSGKRIAYLQWFCHGDPGNMPPLEDENIDDLASSIWLNNLRNDVGPQNMYQRTVSQG